MVNSCAWRKCVYLLMLVLLLLSVAARGEEAETEFPDWLKGTLLISTMGSDQQLDVEYEPIDQYICAFNFDEGETYAMRVPAHGKLMSYRGTPQFLFRQNLTYQTRSTSVSSTGLWYRTVDLSYEMIREEKELLYSCDTVMSFCLSPAPLIIYGVAGEGELEFGGSGYRSYYYLGYGVSADNQLEKQLISWESKRKTTTVYEHFATFPSSNCEIAVAPDGKVAWINEECEIVISDGETTCIVSDGLKNRGAMCWLEDERLLYTVCVTDLENYKWGDPILYEMRIWHTDTNECEILNVTWQDNECYTVVPFASLAYNAEENLLAGYLSPYFDSGDIFFGEILIVSMEDGRSYRFIPWDNEIDRPDMLFRRYGLSDDGIYFCEPGDMIDAQLAWCKD